MPTLRICLAQHGPWIVVAANRHDLSVYDLNVLSKGYPTKDRVDVEYRDTVLSVDDKTKDSVVAKKSDDEAVKEIQRLKDELAKANEELDRIKKRLAAPKP